MAQSSLVAVGTYTRTTSDGIYVCEFDGETGELEPVSSIAGAENPSFLALHPNGRWLYATSEVEEFEGRRQGALYAYDIDADAGRLSLMNVVGSGGAGPCHASVDATGRYLLAANYHGGSVCVAPISDDGSLEPLSCFIQHEGSSVNPDRQEQAHAHSINLDAQNRFAYVPDLGQDKVVIYRLDLERGDTRVSFPRKRESTSARLVANDPPFVETEPGFGPRHFDFHPDGARVYVINELGNTITGYEYDAGSGALTPFQTVGTLPAAGFGRHNTTADVHVHPSGRFVYGSNRGHDSIAIFTVDADTGRLTEAGHRSTQGWTPRNFAIDPSGEFLLAANQDSDDIVTFSIDAETGALTPTGGVTEIPMPVCLRFLG